MADFSDIYEDVMDTINRPTTETLVLAACKRRINDAIRIMQRRRAYRKTERLVAITYPANALTVNVTAFCGGTIRDLICVQLLGTADAKSGTVLPYKSLTQLLGAKQKYQNLNTPGNINEWEFITEQFGHETYASRVHRYYVFLMNGEIGLYPTPTTDTFLLLFGHVWLPDLSADADTNFFLDFGYDLVHDFAVHRMCAYLKQDNRLQFTKEEFALGLDALDLLDSQMSENYTSGPT